MFCILHHLCTKSVDNGHCSIFRDEAVRWRNTKVNVHPCSFATLPEKVIARRKRAKVINALKESKRKARGK